ncbi:MAG: VaFE repeat-containing surface-anchored protein [Corynebacterium aurimucosum]
MVLTAVFTAIAVIAAMVTVPWTKADAAEPTDFVPDNELGGKIVKGFDYGTPEATWSSLTYAGASEYTQGSPKNDVGWAWCIDPSKVYPHTNAKFVYQKSNAEKLAIADKYRDAAINIALKWQETLKQEKQATDPATKRELQKKAGTYVVYLQALVSARPADRTRAVMAITGANPTFENPDGKENYPGFIGSAEEFTELTGLEIVKPSGGEDQGGPAFKKVAEIQSYPKSYYITVVFPKGAKGSYYRESGQRVMPPDQPGLPDDEGESKTPSIGTKAEFAEGSTQVVAGAKVEDTVTYEGLVPGKEYTLFAELISKEDGKTVLGEGEKTFTPESANGEVVVEITVAEFVTEPVEAAVAFEKLTSVEVNKAGEDTPGTDPENPNEIAKHEDINDEAQTVTSKDEPSESTTPEQPGESTTPENPDESTTPKTTEKTTEPSESTTPKTTEPSESTTPGKPGDESGEPKISTNADFANGATEVVAGAQTSKKPLDIPSKNILDSVSKKSLDITQFR